MAKNKNKFEKALMENIENKPKEDIKEDKKASETATESNNNPFNIPMYQKKRTKDKRVNLLLYEDDYKEFQKICKRMHYSTNEMVCQLIKTFIDNYNS